MRATVGERSLAAAGHFNPALAIASSSSWDKCQHSCAAAATGTATPSISCGCAGAGSSSCANAESSLSAGLSMGGSASLSPAVSESLASAQSSMTAASDVQQASSQLSELPTQIVPPALLTMLETPGGSRALAVAARSLLVNNPILRHPGAPCHALLTHLASFSQAQAPSTPLQPPASSAAALSNVEGHSQIASQAGSPQRLQGLASDDSASLDQRTRLRMGHDTERPAADRHVSDAQPNIQQEALAAEAHSMGEQASAVRDAHGRCPAVITRVKCARLESSELMEICHHHAPSISCRQAAHGDVAGSKRRGRGSIEWTLRGLVDCISRGYSAAGPTHWLGGQHK